MDDAAFTYTHNPRPVGATVSFTLKDGRLSVDSGRKFGDVSLDAVEQVRLTYEPGRFGQKAFHTKVTMRNGRSFKFSSLSWKSLVEAQSLDREYRTFVLALCKAVALAAPKARFIAGRPLAVWLANAILAVLCLVAAAFLIWRSLENRAMGAALIGAVFAGICVWQLEPIIRLNKPRPFSAEAPPRELLPPDV